ncbi:NACHT domain-containing protein [Lentzea waywayandensis]|uniref:NACHT domain-containing protein n=1 Tax=Lentzea waywayandensis TaxID=84724 RepID=A0A1I6DZI8_9PSEU|nr:NACHT domain-containing protein [Lentzea waywayandensis]SFR10752.1 NACHT domain-containing protein [Lentzea waywayandensis]
MVKHLTPIIAAIAPPAAAFAFLKTWATAHPVWALVALLGWQVLVWGTTLVSKLLNGVADELGKRWQPRLTEWLDQLLRRRYARFKKQYRESVLSGLRFIDLQGLATVSFYTPDLDEVFVDVSVVFRAPNQVRGDVLAQAPGDVNERYSVWNLLDQPRPVVLAVVGAPGSGKTTLLRYTARRMCRSRRGRRRALPILLYLRDHVAAITANPAVALPNLVTTPGLDEPTGWFERQLVDGNCAVLLDGLDEVASQDDRTSVATWVASQAKRYPRNDFVITSRPHGYETARVDGATVLQVRSFTDAQVSQFIHGWYLAIEQRSTGSTDDDVRKKAQASADDLLRRLEHAPALHDLTVNPLLLTMIAIVHRFRGALPGIRADLYGEICQVLLWRRHNAKALVSVLNGDQKAALLRGLAYTMMRRKIRDMPRDEVLLELRPALRRMSKDISEDEFLSEAGSNGLLLERESGLYSFAHLTFQEYLAAEHIREKHLGEVLTTTVDDVWWRETSLLYVARSDADQIVESCVSSGSVAALSLAFDCADQTTELAPELRSGLDELLKQALDETVPSAVRRLMVGVQLTRHLRHAMVRTSEGTRLCTQPITPELYRSFLSDIEHEEQPLGAIPLFATWANEITDTEDRYRLPTYEEVQHRAVAKLNTWYRDTKEDVYLHTPDPTKNPLEITTEIIREHVLADLEKKSSFVARALLLNAIDHFEQNKSRRSNVALIGQFAALDFAFPISPVDDFEFTSRLRLSLERIPNESVFRFLPRQRYSYLTGAVEVTLGHGLHIAAKAVGTHTRDILTTFADGLLDAARPAGEIVKPFVMAPPKANLHDKSQYPDWTEKAQYLSDALRPYLALKKTLTPKLATEFRLAALCHAAEFGTADYRMLPAKITFLERYGQDEALVLATD